MPFQVTSLLSLLATAFMAVAVTAIPTPNPDASLGMDHDDIEFFKRDSILEPRDLELAEMHGINLTEMYKHSVIKRDDGDHITLWVDTGYADHDDEDDGSLDKRQKTRLAGSANYRDNTVFDWCRDHKRQDHTGPNAPFTGGVKAMYNWAANRHGYFSFGKEYGSHWRALLVAGSNSGANAIYRARMTKSIQSNYIGIGTHDVRNDADWTLGKKRQFNGRWRASSHGGEWCAIPGSAGRRINYQIVRGDNIV